MRRRSDGAAGPPKRNRPRISTTISGTTQAVIVQVAKERALPSPGVTLDYIIHDWVTLRRVYSQVAGLAAAQEEPR